VETYKKHMLRLLELGWTSWGALIILISAAWAVEAAWPHTQVPIYLPWGLGFGGGRTDVGTDPTGHSLHEEQAVAWL
jgi:hypothetical protein